MKLYSYQERDYAFGQRMLTLRTALGLTQAGLAEQLGVSVRAVVGWEGGSSYPSAEHLQQVITLAVRASIFSPGREEQEIRALWKATHQKVLLDERWLATLLGHARPSLGLVAPLSLAPVSVQPTVPVRAAMGPRVEWGEALAVPNFYGREQELATLSRWMVEEGCPMVSVLGLGGIGKSALVVRTMQQLAGHFDVVLFRSLRDAPACEALLESCLQVLAPESLAVLSPGLESRLSRLLSELRNRRVLLVLDNLEALLSKGDVLGRLRPGLEAYADLLRRLAETRHQSCLLLTSREQPAALRALEGRHGPVCSLRLLGLDAAACAKLLAEHGVGGSPLEQARLGQLYAGNPLALNIVAETIVDLFGGEISPFLSTDTTIFGGIAELLEEQWGRLSPLEQTLLCWLAILREPVSLADLQAALVAPPAPEQLLEAVDGLRRRSLLERGQQAGSFTLQSVILEYVTGRLVSTASQEIQHGRLVWLLEFGLSQAQAGEYVRQSQECLLLAPLLARLQSVYQGQAEVEERLRSMLEEVRSWAEDRQGYAPANLVTLLRLLRGNLRGLDLSQLALRGAYLQGVEMQDTNLSEAMIRDSTFTETFDAIWTVAISSSGQFWGAAGRRGEVRVWRGVGQTLYRVWQAHSAIVASLAFSPDERLLASASVDGSLKLWDVESGVLLWSGWHSSAIACLAFAPDGQRLATRGGDDGIIWLWEVSSGTHLQTLIGHSGSVHALAWSPDGKLLASGGVDATIRLWELQGKQAGTCVQTLSGHTHWLFGLAFAPNSRQLASGSRDGTVRLWDVESGRCLHTLEGHNGAIWSVAWSPDGRTVASGGFDHMIWLWDALQGTSRVVLRGHSGVIHALAFTPDSRLLLSGSEDRTLRVWDVQRGEPLRVLEGYSAALYDVSWSPDGQRLASAGTDRLVTLWEVAAETLPRVLQGHRWVVHGVDWSPDGHLLASGGWDNTLRLWNPATGACTQILQDPDSSDTIFFGGAWSPDGHLLANGSYQHGVQVWQMPAGTRRWVGQTGPTFICRVAWSPNGTRLVGAGGDGYVYVWDGSDGTLLRRLVGHHGPVWGVAWSPDGTWLASGGGREGGELFVWDVQRGERLHTLSEPGAVVYALTWSPTGMVLFSGGSDGMVRWWDLRRGECVRVQQAHQGKVQALKVSPNGRTLASCGDDGAIKLWDLEGGEHLRTLRRDRPYERLNITGIQGLTEAEIATLRALGAVEDTAVQSS